MHSTSKQDREFTARVINIDFGEVVDYIAKNCDPDDVFDIRTLTNWALDNGFVKEEEE